MKLSLLLKTVGFTASIVTSLLFSRPTQAISFGEQEVNQNDFIVVAAPYRHGYNLMIVEQLPGGRQCWIENGTNPVFVAPLLLNFDFTNDCKRSVDSNGYSVRLDGQDYGMDYLVNIVEAGGELKLVASSRDSETEAIVIGSTRGMGSGSLKIFLNPGWRLTKRTYEGTTTEHLYLSRDSTAQKQFGQRCNVVGSAE
ncbi:MAG: DUF3747 domain-containing protein [Xenococcaceae cyanobacterium]